MPVFFRLPSSSFLLNSTSNSGQNNDSTNICSYPKYPPSGTIWNHVNWNVPVRKPEGHRVRALHHSLCELRRPFRCARDVQSKEFSESQIVGVGEPT